MTDEAPRPTPGIAAATGAVETSSEAKGAGEGFVWIVTDSDMKGAVQEITPNVGDRIVAILGTSLLDWSLRRAIEDRFIQSSVVEETFRAAGGPLGSLNAKLLLGYLLGMYKKPELAAMRGIAQIRNRFAHQLTVHQFDDSDAELRSAFASLNLHKYYSHYPLNMIAEGKVTDPKIPNASNSRDVFLINLQVLLILLYKDHARHLPNSNVPTGSGSSITIAL